MKKNIILIGLALSLGVFACEQNKTNNAEADETAIVTDKEVMDRDGEQDVEGINVDAVDAWKDVDLNAPKVEMPEVNIKSPDFETRGNDKYTVYSLGENILFETDKATLKADAKKNLEQVAASIKQRYTEGQVRIYGHTDSKDSKSHNQDLAQQRAEAVKTWLTQNAGIEESRISMSAIGEEQPVRSNQTAEGREQNRRVEIVAMNNAASGMNQSSGNSMENEKMEDSQEDMSDDKKEK